MYRDRTVGVVIPAYNEERFVGDVIESVPEFVDRVYVIDDGSTDRTWAAIERHASTVNRTDAMDRGSGAGFDRRVVPLRHERNRGVGGAIKTGYLRAYEDGVDVVAVMAGDGQMDPDTLPRLLDPIADGRADYVKGNRLSAEGNYRGMPAWRLLGSVILTALTRVASGYWRVRDPQNGYTAISREALTAIDIEALYEDYGFCNDLLIRLGARGMTVVDVPTTIDYADEESAIRYRTFVPKLSLLLARRFLWRLRREYRIDDRERTDANLGTPAKHDD